MPAGRTQTKAASRRHDDEEYDDDSLEYTDSEHQFVPQDNDDEVLWDVIEIVGERPKQYRVRWAGTNPATNKPWPLQWVAKADVTPDLVRTWKKKQAETQAKKKSKGKTTKTKATPKPATKKDKEVIDISDDEEEEEEDTRKTRSTVRHNGTNSRSPEAGSSRWQPSSSPGVVIKVGPPKRKRQERPAADKAFARLDIRDDSDLENASQPVLVGPPTKRRKLANGLVPSPKVGSSGTRLAAQVQEKAVEHINAADVDAVPDDRVQQIGSQPSQEAWKENPFASDNPASQNSRRDTISDAQLIDSPTDTLPPDSYGPPPAYTSNDELAGPINAHNSDLDSPQSAGPSTADLAKKPQNERRVNTRIPSHSELRTRIPPTKPLHPIPHLSPSVFKPYLPRPPQPDSPIESFDSPIKPRHSRNTHKSPQRPQSSLTDPSQDPDMAIAEEMEAYLDYSGGERAPSESPLPPPARHKRRRSESPSPSRQQQRGSVPPQNDTSIVLSSQDASGLLTLPPTASTQRADVDSQSQIVLVPDSQVADLTAALQEKDDLIRDLREQLQRQKDEANELTERCQVRDTAVAELRQELDTLRAQGDSLDLAARLEEQTQSLALAQQEASELRETLDSVRMAAAQNPWRAVHEEQLKQLQGEVAKWRSLYEVLRLKDERTNAELRRRAAEEPELRARNEALQTENEASRSRVASLDTELAELRAAKVALEERLQAAEAERVGHEQAVEALNAENASLAERIRELQDSLERLQDESNLQEENSTIQASLLAHRTKEAQVELERLEAERDEASTREEQVRLENVRLQAEVAQSKAEVTALRSELDRLQSRLAEDLNLFGENEKSHPLREAPDSWTCIYRSGGVECHERFDSRLDLCRHVHTTHARVK